MKIAIVGCSHGEQEKIYDLIETIQRRNGYQIDFSLNFSKGPKLKDDVERDLLICCGDFQSTRNLEDLKCMARPEQYMDMCSFYKYYSGEKKAPILTLFVGGNHEASNSLQELPYGGWVAPNIYYLGYAGVVNVNGIRIGGISGIYNGKNYLRGRFEFAPFNEATKRSVYHIREIDVFRLKQLTPKVDILFSHDWPCGVTDYGNKNELFRLMPRFRQQAEENTLGSPPCEGLLRILKPRYWFSAHLHCKFSALIPHNDGKHTKFLALDLCSPEKPFLQVLDIESEEGASQGKVELYYDLEWLNILHLTNHLISVEKNKGYMPGEGGAERFKFTPTEEEKKRVLERFQNDLRIPQNFTRIVKPYNPLVEQNLYMAKMPKAFVNPQTTEFCDKLVIDDPLRLAMSMAGYNLTTSTYIDQIPSSVSISPERNADAVPQDDDEDSCTLADEDQKPMRFLSRANWLASVLPKRQDCTSDLSTLEDSSLSTSNRNILSLPAPQKHGSNLLDNLTIDDLKLTEPFQSETIPPLAMKGIAKLPVDKGRSDAQEGDEV